MILPKVHPIEQIGRHYRIWMLGAFCLCSFAPAALAQDPTSQTSSMQESQSIRKIGISGGVAAGLLLEKSPPVYPPIAKAAHISGTVVLQAAISKTGIAEDLRVISGPPLLQQAAIDAVKTWRYRPYMLAGQPVRVETTVNVIFTLGDQPPASAPAKTSATCKALNPGATAASDPAEFNACLSAVNQMDLKAEAAALESFLQTYPRSLARKPALERLAITYGAANDPGNMVGATSRLLAEDPSNIHSIFLYVIANVSQCLKIGDLQPRDAMTSHAETSDPPACVVQACDDAAALAQSGLAIPRSSLLADEEWTKHADANDAIFHTAIGVDLSNSRKDFKAAIAEYRKALTLLTVEGTKRGLPFAATMKLADAYTKPETRDIVQAIWFFSRAWNFAPEGSAKNRIETVLESYYRDYHGSLEGLDAVKSQAAASVFPPETFTIPAGPASSSKSDREPQRP
jgi:TonB family protein